MSEYKRPEPKDNEDFETYLLQWEKIGLTLNFIAPKYKKLLEFVVGLAKPEKYSNSVIERILEDCAIHHPAFVEAFIIKNARCLLKEIGELND